ncbi:hypothetical protein FA15DRAFT_251126 [Coprinopsis marcescibilis]|uniref:F-box domain-containing protein n=1 Tax=Coprinopsis marcescibilis TaxID=230819 RepID=A0A5C3L2W7_COPMA|nr:hypothetical protein FA15DRAFT_251126 [Coprinopsis marcescibilis]
MSISSSTQSVYTNNVVIRFSIPNYRPIESEFTPFLSNNDPPPDDLIKPARARAGHPNIARQTIAAQIDMLNQRLAQLQQLSTQFADQEDSYLSIASLSRRFPSELIVEVAKWCFKDDGVMDEQDRLTFMHLRCVSRRWREALLSAHCFWRGLHVRNGWPVAKAICSWFDRGGPDWPVVLRIDEWDPPQANDLPYETPGRLTLLFKSQRQWKEIKLPENMDPHCVRHILESLSDGPLQSWENCVMLRLPSWEGWVAWPSLRRRSRTFAQALPNLQTLELTLAKSSVKSPISHPTVSDLRVDLSHIVAVEGLLSLLTTLPNVQKLSLVGTRLGRSVASSGSLGRRQIELPNVRYLQLTASVADYIRHILLPNLDTLKIVTANQNPMSSTLVPLLNLLHNSLLLRTIDLEESEFSAPCVASVLKHAPKSVEELRVAGPGWYIFKVFLDDAQFGDEDVLAGLKRIYHPCFDPADFDILIRFFSKRKTRLDGNVCLEAAQGDKKGTGQIISIIYEDISKLDTSICAEQVEKLRCLGVTLSSSS